MSAVSPALHVVQQQQHLHIGFEASRSPTAAAAEEARASEAQQALRSAGAPSVYCPPLVAWP